MRYFTECRTAEDVKKAYYKYAKQMHPDNGGTEKEFKEMKAEYERAWDRLKNVHQTKDGDTYEKQTTGQEARQAADAGKVFTDIIDRIIHMSGCKIEIIGSWIWISGNTIIYKDELKALGFIWSKSKKAWYYTGDGSKKPRRRGQYSLDGLRNHWGTTEVKTEDQKKITA